MLHPSPGRFRTVDELLEHAAAVAPGLRADRELEGRDGPLGQPIRIGDRLVGNRFAVHPMEGWDARDDGLPSDHTRRRWRRFGESGAQLIWGGEAFAVCGDGRANPNQLFLNDDADVGAGLRALLEELRAGHASIGEDPDVLLVGLQLTHSGRFARPTTAGPRPLIAHRHPILDPRFGIDADDAIADDQTLERIADRFVRAAGLAASAGFDFVDVKCCHGYLLHELLSARQRPGPYGGSLENRTRLVRHVIGEIRRRHPDLDVAVRLSATDVFPHGRGDDGIGVPIGVESARPYTHGFGVDSDDPLAPDLEEPLRLLEMLAELGVRLVNVTIGSPYYCPHVQRPAAYPPSDGYAPPEDPLRSVQRHLDVVRACRAAGPPLVLVGSGYSYLQEHLPNVAQAEVRSGAVDLVGLGRMALAYPHMPRDVLDGRPLQRKLICRTFSDCTTAPRNGFVSGCYPLDPHYGSMPQAVRIRAIRKAAAAERRR